MHIYIHANIHTCTYTYMHIYIHACIHTCIYTYIHTCIHTCLLGRKGLRSRIACEQGSYVYVSVYMHAYTHTCLLGRKWLRSRITCEQGSYVYVSEGFSHRSCACIKLAQNWRQFREYLFPPVLLCAGGRASWFTFGACVCVCLCLRHLVHTYICTYTRTCVDLHASHTHPACMHSVSLAPVVDQ